MLTVKDLKLLSKNDKIRVDYKFNDPNHSAYVKRMVSAGIMSPLVAPKEHSYEGIVTLNNEDKLKVKLNSGSTLTFHYDEIHESGTVGIDTTFHIKFVKI